MIAQPHVGERIKKVRLEKGLTLKDVEARSGVSATHVSEVERGLTSPTVGVLTRIAAALDTEPSHLVALEASPHEVVVRRAERRRVRLDDPPVWLESLVGSGAGGDLSLFLVDWDQDVGDGTLCLSNTGEEFALVLSGCLEFEVRGERYVLEEGDSIHYAAALPHSVRRLGDAPCRSVWATYPRLTF